MFAWTSDDLQILRLSVSVAALATLASLGPAIAVATLLARRRFWGHAAVNAHRPPAAGPAAGRHRLLPAARLRHARPDRRLAGRHARHRLRVPLDGRGAGRGGDGLPADGARDPHVDRERRSAARGGRRDARRVAGVAAADDHAAAGRARASSPAPSSASPRRSASSARRSPSSRTSRARRRRWRWRSTR